MRSYLKLLAIALLLFSCETEQKDKVANFQTHFETSKGKETATYLQAIDFYIRLAKEFPEINIQTIGETDSGYPLHIVTFNPEGDFNFQKIGQDKTIVLINNGIHPGESDGIDATMMLYRDLATENIPSPKNAILVTIPVYNVGGALNRNSGTRVNQNGPESYGFRGNAQNYDLNRDFIKADSKNAKTFADIFHLVSPDIFIDNHVSNGADYQYTLTHLFTQHNKLGGELGKYLHQELMPTLEKSLEADQWDITPYVNVFNDVPEKGFSQFMDHPRYSTGYTTLWNTLGMMVETHMLKPYKKRVEGTYALMTKVIDIADKDSKRIKELRQKAFSDRTNGSTYPVQWKIDTTASTTLNFKGYEGTRIPSEITGFPRLKYNRDQPFVKEVRYRNYFLPSKSVQIPEAYIVKKGWSKIMEHMDRNHIDYDLVTQDTLVNVEVYHIEDYKTRQNPYEGHYLHYDTEVQKSMKQVAFHEGDYIIPTNQPGIRYILETLEPEAPDSFFNWNFFDTVLQQKEGFSPYVFEDTALRILKGDTKMREAFLSKKETDTIFAKNWYSQLDWIYQRSRHAEEAYRQYPVYRYLNKDKS